MGEQAGVDGGQPVDVLRRVERRHDPVGVDVGGDRQLHEDAVDVLVPVERFDQIQQLGLRCLAPEPVVGGAQADLLAGPVLAGDVHLRGGIVADDHGHQLRCSAPLALKGAHLGRHALAHRGGNRFAVDDPGRH